MEIETFNSEKCYFYFVNYFLLISAFLFGNTKKFHSKPVFL